MMMRFISYCKYMLATFKVANQWKGWNQDSLYQFLEKIIYIHWPHANFFWKVYPRFANFAKNHLILFSVPKSLWLIPFSIPKSWKRPILGDIFPVPVTFVADVSELLTWAIFWIVFENISVMDVKALSFLLSYFYWNCVKVLLYGISFLRQRILSIYPTGWPKTLWAEEAFYA